MDEKMFRVTVTLEVYGLDSKDEVAAHLDALLDIDGIILQEQGEPVEVIRK